jgi:hypothetical protein
VSGRAFSVPLLHVATCVAQGTQSPVPYRAVDSGEPRRVSGRAFRVPKLHVATCVAQVAQSPVPYGPRLTGAFWFCLLIFTLKVPPSMIVSRQFDLFRVSVAFACVLLLALHVRAQDMHALDFPATGSMLDASNPNQLLFFGGHSLAFFDVSERRVVQKHQLDDRTITSACWTMDGRLILSGTRDGDGGWVGCFANRDYQTMQWQAELKHRVTCLASSNQRVLVGNDVGEITAIDAQTGRVEWLQQLHSKLVTCLAVSSPERCASSDWTGKIVVFDLRDGIEQTNFQQHRAQVSGLLVRTTINPLRLYSASRDGTVRLWYPAQGRLVRFVQLEEPISAICCMYDNLVVAATRDSKLHTLDMDRAKVVAEQPSGLEYVTGLSCLNATRLVAVDGKSHVRIIELPTL